MKILVAVKRVVDYNVRVRVKADLSGVVTDDVKMSMNPFDEIAVVEAVQLKEKGICSEIVVVSFGSEECSETIRQGLALGGDRGILVQTEGVLDCLGIAKGLREIVLKESPSLVLLGKQSIDGDNNQTGQMLAGLLGWAQGTFASEIVIEDECAKVTREVDGGLLNLSLKLPAVVTTDLRLNEPRYASLPNIMAAKKKTIEVIGWDSLGVENVSRVSVLKVEEPPVRRAGVRVESVSELVGLLKDEAKVLG